MVRQTARVLFFEIVGGILFLAILAAALFAWRLSQGPVGLNAFKGDIEAALTDARGGRGVSLGSVALEWSPEARRVNVTAYELAFRDSDGAPAGEAHRAEIVLDASALLLGEAEIISMRLRDGSMTIEQVSDAVWEVAGEPLPPIPSGTLPTTPAEWVALSERAMAALLAAGQRTVSAARLETIAVEGFTVGVRLQDGSQLIEIADAEGAFTQDGTDFRLSLSGQGVGRGLPRGVALDLQSSGGVEALRGEMAFASWTVSDLLGRIGIADERASGLPADMAFAFEFAGNVGLRGLSAQVAAGAGDVTIAGRPYGLDRVVGRLDYDPVADVAALEVETLEAALAKGSFRLQLGDAITPEARARPVAFTADTLTMDLTPVFEAPFSFTNISLEGVADLTAHTLDITELETGIGPATLEASGRLERTPDWQPGDLPLLLDLAASVTGPLPVDTVTRFWPVRLGPGGRRFATERIEAGIVTRADATITLKRDSLADGHLRDSDLEVRFAVEDARVRAVSDLPAVDNAAGTARMTGNGMTVDLATGTFGSWRLTSGSVDITKFNPRGEDILVKATGEGSATDMLTYVFESDLQLEEATGFDPDRVTGDARASFEMRRPALDNVPIEDTDIRVIAEVLDGGLKDIGAGFDLTDARARVDVDKTTVRVTGNGRAGPALVNFAWRDGLDDGDAPSVLTAQAVVTPDILNAFGLLGRPYLSGEIPVDIDATLDGSELGTANLDIDLSGARIDLAEIGWLKPPGEAARAIVKYDFTGETRVASADLQSEMAGLSGDVILGSDGRLRLFDLSRAFLDDRVDVAGRIERVGDDGVSIQLEGPFLDVSPLFADLGALGSSSGAAGGAPVSLSARVDRLRFSLDRDLVDATFEAQTDEAGLALVTASGAMEQGGVVEARYVREGTGAEVMLKSDDAGLLFSAVLGDDLLADGAIDVSGRLEWDGSPSELDVLVTDARLREAPILTQLLSLASLRGLVDTLGGEGVLFSEIRVPLTISGDRYSIDGGRASGPALGLTVNGWVEPATGKIEMNGVLVPSFGMNSALGGIPIIGDLVVGREGEGILSLTYSVRGELDRAQVAVNPLSAVAPGVLRRIFENPSDPALPLPGDATPGE